MHALLRWNALNLPQRLRCVLSVDAPLGREFPRCYGRDLPDQADRCGSPLTGSVAVQIVSAVDTEVGDHAQQSRSSLHTRARRRGAGVLPCAAPQPKTWARIGHKEPQRAALGRCQPDKLRPDAVPSDRLPGLQSRRSERRCARQGLGGLPCTKSPAGVAQQAEQPSCKRQVSGSIPLTGSTLNAYSRAPVGRRATQLTRGPWPRW